MGPFGEDLETVPLGTRLSGGECYRQLVCFRFDVECESLPLGAKKLQAFVQEVCRRERELRQKSAANCRRRISRRRGSARARRTCGCSCCSPAPERSSSPWTGASAQSSSRRSCKQRCCKVCCWQERSSKCGAVSCGCWRGRKHTATLIDNYIGAAEEELRASGGSEGAGNHTSQQCPCWACQKSALGGCVSCTAQAFGIGGP